MDTADYALLRQCVPNARFASAATLGNSHRTACSSAGAITPRNRNFARMRRHMAAALIVGGNCTKSHTTAQEQSPQTAGSASFVPSCNNMDDDDDDDDIETEMALLEQVLGHTSGVAQFQHYSAFVDGDD